jgi:hypothetical protein
MPTKDTITIGEIADISIFKIAIEGVKSFNWAAEDNQSIDMTDSEDEFNLVMGAISSIKMSGNCML